MQIILTSKEKEAFDDMLHSLDPELVNVICDSFENNCCYTTFEYGGDTVIVIDPTYVIFNFDKYGVLTCKLINKMMDFAKIYSTYVEEEKALVKNIRRRRSGIAPKKYKKSSFLKQLINGESNDPLRVKYHSKLNDLINQETGKGSKCNE